MVNSLEGLFAKALKLGSALILAISVIGGIAGLTVAGMAGLWSALIGAALALVFVTLTALSVWLGSKLPLGGFFGVVLGGWLVKVIGFILAISVLRQADFVNGPVLFFTLVAAILGSLGVDSFLVLRSRIPIIPDQA